MGINVTLPKLTRRTFLEASAAAVALGAIGDKLFDGPMSTLIENALAEQVTEDKWVPSSCNSCDRGCSILVHVVDGTVVKIEGNPDDFDNEGKVCGRSQALPMYLYNPWRVKAPMKRTNPEKGKSVNPEWVEITWDEALDTVANNLRSIREKDPRRLVVVSGHRGFDTSFAGGTWGRVFGTPTPDNSSFGGQTCHGCELHTMNAWVCGSFVAGPDIHYSNYVLSFGDGMYMANKATPGDNKSVRRAKERGARFVSVDPLQAPSSRNVADEWIPIKPGTDKAFLLAMIHTITHEIGIYDVEFLKRRTNAPYLIGPDSLYVRANDSLIKDPARLNQEIGKPFVWDPVDNTAKVFDDPTIKDFALEGVYTVNGIECQPAFQLLKDHVRQNTPEWAEEETGVSAATIRRISKEFVDAAQIGSTIVIDGVEMPYRPAACTTGRGPGVTADGPDSGYARSILNILIGNINVPGGLISGAYGPPVMTADPADGILQPGVGYHTAVYHPITYPPQRADTQDLYPIAYKTHYLLWPAIVNPQEYHLDYEVEALFINASNPMGGAGLETIRKALAKVPFISTIAYQFDEIAEWSDIVLPDSSLLERHAIGGISAFQYPFWSSDDKVKTIYRMRQPVLAQPVFNTREGNDILIDISERIGMLYGNDGLNNAINNGRPPLKDAYQLDLNTRYSWAEILDRMCKNSFGDDHGLEWFKENGYFAQELPIEDYYGTPKWPTTRVPLYFEYAVWAGKQLEKEFQNYNVTKVAPYDSIQSILAEYRPLPIYRNGPDNDAPSEYDLWVCHYKTMIQSMAMPMMSNAWLYANSTTWDPYEMFVWINADTAATKGLKDGDLVVVESRYGTTQGEIKTSQCIHPQAIGIGGLNGVFSENAPDHFRDGPSWNELLPLVEKEGKFTNPVMGGNHMHVKVKVYKA